MDKLSKEQRRKNMQAVKSSGTKIERELAKAIWGKGYRYRKNNKKVFGRPDLTISKYRLAIFVDGEFWHGKNWSVRMNDHKTNQKFWIRKIEGNISRDRIVNRRLRKEGWIVIRFWGKDVLRNLDKCILKIQDKIIETKS